MTDAEVIARILDGQKELFAELVERHKDFVYGVILGSTNGDREEAEDLAQEVFIKAYRSLSGFRRESSFSTWVYRIAVNHMADHFRSRKPVTVALDGVLNGSLSDSGSTPEEEAFSMEQRIIVQRSLAELSDDYRQVLFLYHYHGLSYAEIAARLNIPVKTVETRLYRAKKVLRSKLEVLRS